MSDQDVNNDASGDVKNDDQGANAGSAGQATGEPDYKAEYEKWKALSRKNESEAEKLRKELDKFRQANMTESEKALQEAMEKGRKAALSEMGTRLAEAEIKAAAANAGRKVPDGFSNFLNMTAFIGEDGTPNGDAITAFINSLPEATPKGPAFSQNTGIGPQGSGGVPQLTREDMARMTPQEIVKAREEGRFDFLLGN